MGKDCISEVARKRAFIAVFAGALVVRGLFLFFAPAQYQVFGDSEEYIETARRLCATGRYPFEHIALPTFRAPGFPILISLISGCLLLPVWCIKVGLIVLDSAACLSGMGIVYYIAERGRTGVRALFFGLLYSCYPLFVQQSVTVQSEVFTVFSIVAGLFLISRRFVKRNLLGPKEAFCLTLAAGAFFGVAVLTRPSALVLPMVFIPAVLFSKSEIRRIGLTALLGAAFVIAPWSIYATVRTGKLTLVNDSFCYSFYRGSRLELLDVYTATDSDTFTLAAKRSEAVIRDAERQIVDGSWCKAALDLLKQNPLKQLKLALLKTWAFYRPWPHQGAHKLWITLIVGAIVGSLYLSFLIVLLQHSANSGIRRIKTWACISVVLVALFHLPHQVSNRYRVPLVDPILMILVAAFARVPARNYSLRWVH